MATPISAQRRAGFVVRPARRNSNDREAIKEAAEPSSMASYQVLHIEPADFGVADRMHAWRIRRAMLKSQHVDTVFFRRNPNRSHYIRASIPYERPGWGATDHTLQPFMLVRVEDGMLHRLGITGKPRGFGDEEEFCRRLSSRLRAELGSESGSMNVSPEEVVTMLEHAGYEVNHG